MDDWYTEAFSRDYLKIYAHRDVAEAEAVINGLLRRVRLPPRPICLDLCCGSGRHLWHLNRKGIHTYGIDLSPYLLTKARQACSKRNHLIQADMRRLPFKPVFDFVFSFFSSFGYFADDKENLGVLEELCRILKPGGGFLIDTFNAEHVRRHLRAEDYEESADFSLLQQRWIDEERNTVEKKLVITDGDGSRTYRERVKLYGVGHFEEFFRSVGLTITATMGDADGSAFHPNAPRLVLIGEKVADSSS